MNMDCLDNPLISVKACAPQREDVMPLELYAGSGGYVGLKFCPVYTPQWKETGVWQQRYAAYPQEGRVFTGWFSENGACLSTESIWVDEYGMSRVLEARFV